MQDPEATEAAAPPLDPPAVRSGSKGLAVSGPSRLSCGGRLAELRDVGLADDHGSGPAQPAHGPGVLAGHIAGMGQRTERGDVALDVEGILDRDRDASERARAAVPVGGLGCSGLAPGQLGGGQDEGVEDRIDLGDAFLGQFRNLDG